MKDLILYSIFQLFAVAAAGFIVVMIIRSEGITGFDYIELPDEEWCIQDLVD